MELLDLLTSESEAREKKRYISREDVIYEIKNAMSRGHHECKVSGYITDELREELFRLGYYVHSFGPETKLFW